MIPYGRQEIMEQDIEAVVDILRSDFLTQGPVVPQFEQVVAGLCAAQYAVAVNSATSALHIACLSLNLGPGDWLWTSPITFMASANSGLYCGAKVDFVDIDPCTYNMSIECLAEKLAQAEKEGKLPKVVIPVHLSGQSCDMASIHELSQRYNFKIIEDASHAIGGKYKDQAIGGCRFSDITVFSFHPVKIITSGEGGMALTNNSLIAKKMQLLRSHGISSHKEDMGFRAPEEIWNYQQLDLGFNYRMTDIHAALGLSQMQWLDEFIKKRHVIAQRYNQELFDLPLTTPHQHEDSYSSFHLYIISLKLDEIGKTHRQVYDELRSAGILVNLHYIPVYRQPYYERMGFKVGYCPQAEKYYSEAISIPMYPALKESDLSYIISSLKIIFSK